MRHHNSLATVRPDHTDRYHAPTTGELVGVLPDPSADVHQAAVTKIEEARVRSFVRKLPMLERKVIVARYGLAGEELTCRQAASQLGISASGVSAIEHRALDRLRAMYGLAPGA